VSTEETLASKFREEAKVVNENLLNLKTCSCLQFFFSLVGNRLKFLPNRAENNIIIKT
jgi:hypothetical protein